MFIRRPDLLEANEIVEEEEPPEFLPNTFGLLAAKSFTAEATVDLEFVEGKLKIPSWRGTVSSPW